MPTERINIGLIDDHAMFRKAIKDYLLHYPDIHVTIEDADTRNLLTIIKTTPCDLLILDLCIPNCNVPELIQQIRQQYTRTRIIVLSMCTEISIISGLLDLGIHGYLSKAADPEELYEAIISVYHNKIYKSALFTEALYWNKTEVTPGNRPTAKTVYTEREKQILQLIWEEKTTREIAATFFLGTRSIEKIRQEMKEKIGVSTTVGMLKYALKNKIIRDDMAVWDMTGHEDKRIG